nr:class I SAM-dependent methyltransferase [Acidocella sp.]
QPALARQILGLVEPELIRLRPPYAPAGRDALFALGILHLQEEGDLRRSVTSFVRLRDGLVKLTPPGQEPDQLFWPALRGEVVALHRLSRAEEATELLETFLATYPGAPDDLRQQIEK